MVCHHSSVSGHLCPHVVAWLTVWILVCVLPAVVHAESTAAGMPTPRPISDGMTLTRQGISGNMCALTFDDGPSKHTARLLDILKLHGVRATFFVVGSQVERRPDLIRRMIDEGHEVGNHSYSHNALRRQSPEDQQADLRKLDTLLRELGVQPRFVRPPYGFYDHNTVNAVREMDGHMVMWSIDSLDWRKNMDLSRMQAMYSGAPLRGVFLFHDTHAQTVDRMPEIITALAATDCRFVTLSEYIDGPQNTQELTTAVTTAPAPSSPTVAASATPTPAVQAGTSVPAAEAPVRQLVVAPVTDPAQGTVLGTGVTPVNGSQQPPAHLVSPFKSAPRTSDAGAGAVAPVPGVVTPTITSTITPPALPNTPATPSTAATRTKAPTNHTLQGGASAQAVATTPRQNRPRVTMVFEPLMRSFRPTRQSGPQNGPQSVPQIVPVMLKPTPQQAVAPRESGLRPQRVMPELASGAHELTGSPVPN